jgi:hypothetical protein
MRECRYSATNLDGGEWLASRPDRFTHREIAPGTYWIEGWVGPRAGLEVEEKRKILNFPGFEPPAVDTHTHTHTHTHTYIYIYIYMCMNCPSHHP